VKQKLSYIDSVHRDGTVWNLTVMALLVMFPVSLCFLFGTAPDWGALAMHIHRTTQLSMRIWSRSASKRSIRSMFR